MKENVGLSAIIIAAFAFMIRTGAPGPPVGEAGRSKEPKAQKSAPQPVSNDYIEGPWLATRAYFHSVDDSKSPVDLENPSQVQNCVRMPGDCRGKVAKYFGIQDPDPIQFMIATVSDPLHSRLSLATDAGIEAIEDAAGASGWTFATQWLPWLDATDPDEKDPQKRREERDDIRRQEKQPGILVFRHEPSLRKADAAFGKEVLVIFLAGETPTAGVNPTQFQLARAYMRAIHEPRDKVRILGPTFSGSFEGMSGLFAEDRMQGPVYEYRVRSGTVTGIINGSIFQQSGVNFHSATSSTADQDKNFRKVLHDLGLQTRQAALLIEDESAFGQDATDAAVATDATVAAGEKGQESIRVFRFPRDISHLRNAYHDAVAASKSSNSVQPDIEFSIKDPESGEDSIPIFSASQSPLSQYGVINRITSAIRRDGVRVVEVSATNVLDMLFLSEVLRRQCPDTRLVLSYPDVLLIQDAQNEPLAGTLVLANYPMFFQSNNWMGWHQKKEPKAFSDANSEGVYNATVLLLSDDKDPRGVLADYYWGGRDHPPTWLLTLDRQGFLPVDVFPHTTKEEPTDTWFQPVPATAPGTQPVFHSPTPPLPPPPRAWSFVSTAVALVCVALSLWILVISLDRNLEMDARFSFLQINSESGWRRFYILTLLAVLLLMEAIVWIPGWRTEWVDRWVATEVYLIPALGCAAVFFTALAVLTMLKPDRRVRIQVWLGVAGMAALFPACLAFWMRASLSSNDRSLFFAFRALELRFGSSPTWPVLAALGAFALFAFVHLTRFYLAACQKPDIVTDELATALRARLREACDNLNGALESALGLRRTARRHRIGLVLFGIGSLVAIVFRIDLQMRSIDSGHWPVVILQIVLMILLLITGMHIRSLWQSFQSFLGGLNMLPLAHSFKPVDHSGTERPIWVRRLNLGSIDVDVQSIYAIHNMTIAAKALAPDFPHAEYLTWLKTKSAEYSGRVRDLLSVDRRSRETTLKLTRAIRNDNKAIASETLKFLDQFWRATPLTSPEVVEKPDHSGNGEQKERAPAKGPFEELGGLAQRFVALHYSSFILYAVRQIQNLFLFLSSGFVLLMISLNCYSIQGPQFIGRVLLALFLILGSVTLPCLAGLERDPVLSRMAGSEPGKLNTGFYLKIATYGALPALGLLASEFPSISGFLLSWVEPTLEAFR